MNNWQRAPASFINDEVLAIQVKVTTVATVRGDVLFQNTLPKGHYFLRPIPSAGGERFALKEERLRGLRSEPLDMYPFQSDDRVIVYSIEDSHAIFSLKLRGTSPWSPWSIHDNSVALSPDGTSLALLSDGLLQTYAIPKETTDQH